MTVKAELLVVPRESAMPYYLDWFAQRKATVPSMVKNGIFIAHADQGPICGVCIYETDGPYFFLEHFCSNPHAAKRLVHRAALYMIETAKAFGAITSKYPLLSANSAGLVRVCRRGGFIQSNSVSMYAMPVVALTPAKESPAAPKKRAKRKRDGQVRPG